MHHYTKYIEEADFEQAIESVRDIYYQYIDLDDSEYEEF